MSIDHINRNKLDNRIDNLRIVNSSIQNSNMDKKKGPKQLNHFLLNYSRKYWKYVYYYSETI